MYVCMCVCKVPMDPHSTLIDQTYTHLILIPRLGLEMHVFRGSLAECYCLLRLVGGVSGREPTRLVE